MSKSDIYRRISGAFEQLCSRMLAEYSFAEGTVLFPFITSILEKCVNIIKKNDNYIAHDKFLISDGRREISIEYNAKVIGIVSLFRDYVF